MNRSRRQATRQLGAALLAAGLYSPMQAALAQAWPTQPIRVIVNFGPGSSPDIVARAVAPQLSQALGQPVTVENRAGGGGVVGLDAVHRAAANGYTLGMLAGSTMVIGPHLHRLAFDPLREMVPVAAGARLNYFLVIRTGLPFDDYAGFIRYMRANPGRLNFGSPGIGSAPHLAAEMLRMATNTFAVHIPYRGSAGVLADLLAGTLDWAFDPGISFAHVREGRLRMLAVSGQRRAALFPNVPTLRELGLADFDVAATHGFWAPPGTPAPIVERLNREINRALGMPAVADPIRGFGAEPTPLTPAQFLALSRADSELYGRVVRERRITLD
jgi:tripartite-type tricarboxylate transporter receptor subunit TctC